MPYLTSSTTWRPACAGAEGLEALGEVNARLRDGFEAVVLEAFEDGEFSPSPCSTRPWWPSGGVGTSP
jgi:hypothetical protein